jgi:4-alpha-glucanotransferase
VPGERPLRRSGILLHPTSLPGRWGIGDLGDEAERFVDFLVATKQSLWQVLPLGPTGYGDSPYQSFSSFAGNPLLVSPDRLIADGLVEPDDLGDVPGFAAEQVDYGAVIACKRALLARAAARFSARASRAVADEFTAFCRDEASWLDDFTLFMALKDAHGGAVWTQWEPDVARRRPDALARSRARLADSIMSHKLSQFWFARQWRAVKQYANERGVEVIGDIPIFVAHDSADVWSRPDLFFLDEHGEPTLVAGVPPDAFSASGQLWGNPLYRWDVMAEQGFVWWIERLRRTLSVVDIVRIDHFIGFTRVWAVPAGESDATGGAWLPGPGAALGNAIGAALGRLPIIAEDLGFLTPEAEALRDQFRLPGMKVLQFAFDGDPSNPHLPHNHRTSFVVYTGTHDNDTTVGWFQTAPPATRSFLQRYLARSGDDVAYDLIRAAMGSVADTVIVPLQDVLGLGGEARMNHPGRASGNWSWRLPADALAQANVERFAEMVELYGRGPAAGPETQAPSFEPSSRSRVETIPPEDRGDRR